MTLLTQLSLATLMATIPAACVRVALASSDNAQAVYISAAPSNVLSKLEATRILILDDQASIYKCSPIELSPKLTLRQRKQRGARK